MTANQSRHSCSQRSWRTGSLHLYLSFSCSMMAAWACGARSGLLRDDCELPPDATRECSTLRDAEVEEAAPDVAPICVDLTRFCRHPLAPKQPTKVVGVGEGMLVVELGKAVLAQDNRLVSWAIGNSLFGVTRLDKQPATLALDLPNVQTQYQGSPPPFFSRGAEIGFALGHDDGSTSMVMIDPISLTAKPAIQVPIEKEDNISRIAMLADEEHLFVLSGTPASLSILDASFGTVIRRTQIASDYGSEYTLTRTCNGMLATWIDLVDFAIHARSLGPDGTPLGPERVVMAFPDDEPFPAYAQAIWDGSSLVLQREKLILEINTDASLESSTRFDKKIIGAIGTDEGLLVLANPPSAVTNEGPRLLHVSRGAAEVLDDFGPVPEVSFPAAPVAGVLASAGLARFSFTDSDQSGNILNIDVHCNTH